VALGRMDRNFIERQWGGYGGKLKCHNSRTDPFAFYVKNYSLTPFRPLFQKFGANA
jgi:hypothetical protein